MRILNTFFAVSSIVGILATFSSNNLVASFSHGTKKRFTTNPGASVTCIAVLPIIPEKMSAKETVFSLVFLPGIISSKRFFAG